MKDIAITDDPYGMLLKMDTGSFSTVMIMTQYMFMFVKEVVKPCF